MPSNSDDVRRALTSVYFHTRFDTSEWLPPEFRPIPLSRALDILGQETSRRGQSQRRRAIAKLFIAAPSPTRDEALSRVAAEELRTLRDAQEKTRAGSSPIPNLDQRLEAPLKELELLFPGTRAVAAGSGQFNFQFNSWRFWRWVNLVLDQEFGPILMCERSEPVTTVQYNADSSTSVTSVITVTRPLTAMRAVVDPQNWDHCGPELWKNAYIAQASGGNYLVDAQYNAAQAVTPPPDLGATWAAVLFEHVALDLLGMSLAEFKLLLDIDAKNTVGGGFAQYDVKFSCRTSLYSNVGWMQMEGGIARDEGQVLAKGYQLSGLDKTAVSFTKTLQFDGSWGFPTLWFLNWGLDHGLTLLGDGLYDWVCC